MSKRIIALLLCAFMLIPCLAACAAKDEDDLGAYITMYLTDDIYDFDPANAYNNKEALSVVSLMFDTLFTLNDKGKVKKSLVDKYVIKEDVEKGEYTMELTLKETAWSNGTPISADDVVFAWKRLVNQSNNYAAAALLYDIKNARAVKESDIPIDDLGVEAVSAKVVKVTFEGAIDYDQFLLNLTSVATAPLYEQYVIKNEDWAKRPSTMVTSGAYKMGKISCLNVDENGALIQDKNTAGVTAWDDYAFDSVYYGEEKDEDRPAGVLGSGEFNVKDIDYFYLERNSYYYRDLDDDAVDKYVKNYRILVNCNMTDEEILQAYKNNEIFYIGDIPMSLRKDAYVQEHAEISDSLSTFTLFLNENAVLDDGTKNGYKLFADKNVRQALSLVIDRAAIADEIVYAEAATGLIPNGVLYGTGKDQFRDVNGEVISPISTDDKMSANEAWARELITASNIVPADFTFAVSYSAKDEVHAKIVEMVVAAWQKLGFNAVATPVEMIENNDYHKDVMAVPTDCCDDLLMESVKRGTYQVAAYDYVAYSADAYSMLAPFALSFAGSALDENYNLVPGFTGFNNETYNDLIEAIYFIPYFTGLTEDDHEFLGLYDTPEEFKAVYNKVKAVYKANNITPSDDPKDWTRQRAFLLQLAEKLLLEEMPVIPVVFNQNAILVGDDLSRVESDYYVPALFKNTKLKNYEDLVPVFENFPTIDWSLKGYVEPKEED